ncbi:hypothetical protein AAFF_G00195670 [Aldrovandia affinis]|uniref:Centromere protein P n=1 Tax=Aldrovandia affinis TaxID=143900 RepID=A0AAD7RJ33_9TELE|nr:hypothetical protein AAFF_G00195670 [Aldrovandia affinis]
MELENLEEDLARQAKINGIVLAECEVKTVEKMEEKSSLLLFFRTLKGFAERCEHRNRTFQHFKQKYPEVVSLPGGFRGEVMVIQDPKVPGCTLSIVWKINVSKDGVITPKMDLLAKLPEQALDLGQQVAENAPQAFQSLVRILGVEAAIENLITAVCME